MRYLNSLRDRHSVLEGISFPMFDVRRDQREFSTLWASHCGQKETLHVGSHPSLYVCMCVRVKKNAC